MRRYRTALTAATALTLASLALLAAGPAHAGGPTSVLLVVPGAGATASLYTGDGDYETLARDVGAFSGTGTAGEVDGSGTEHASGPEVTLTWLIHDVTVWRVDRVYLDAAGGPWIATQWDASGDGSIGSAAPVWHTAVDAKELAALLHRLGVAGVPDAGPGPASTSPDQPDVTSGQKATDTTSGAAPPATQPAADASGPDAGMLGWGLGGIALGVALTLAAGRVGRRSRPVADEQPAASGIGTDRVPDETGWSPAERLQRR